MDTPRSPDRIEQILTERLPKQIREVPAFERWFEPLRMRVQVAAAMVRDDVYRALESAKERVFEQETVERKIWSVTGTDGESLMKSVASVRSKLGRKLCKLELGDGLLEGRMSLDQIEKLLLAFGDLGRFRIVCDLSLDVEQALRVLFPQSDKLLMGRYPRYGEIKDFVYDLELRRPARGHRARQFTVEVREAGNSLRVEIQLMTLLQNAWDQRNHPLYEWQREGGPLPPRLRVNDVALAETLHLVDEQATRNWREFLEIKRGSR